MQNQANMTHLKAFAFNANCTLRELKEYLSDNMQSNWILGNNEYFGEYIALKCADTGSIFRIFGSFGHFEFDVLNKKGCSKEQYLKELESFKKLLQDKGATAFTKTDDY